ncbi:cytochrome c [Hyphomicrobium sp. CS1GBMeth3]|uniref:c-type cytochrome n=1 Tax=Hyphomicrobium sp. CS1GBMeth3 TaxID=1892845 RepID=UPI00092FDB89|nr:cytochrome c [Hyphomicrobium sp. CS1GBMeth3]
MKGQSFAFAALALLMAETASAQPDRVELGRQALESRCSRCHAIGAEGASPHSEAPPFRDVVKRYPPEALEESLAEGIASGHPDMPEFVLAPEEIDGVVAYLNTLSDN